MVRSPDRRFLSPGSTPRYSLVGRFRPLAPRSGEPREAMADQIAAVGSPVLAGSRLLLPRQAGGGLMCALAEIAAQAGGQRYGRLSELVAQPVGGRQRLAPFLVFLFAHQVQLVVALGPGRNVHS